MTDSTLHNTLRENIVPYIKDDAWFQQAALERAVYELTELQERMDRFDELMLSFVSDLAKLLGDHPILLCKPLGPDKKRTLRKHAFTAIKLRQSILLSYRSFLRNTYRKYLPSENGLVVVDEAVDNLKKVLSERFELILEPDTKKILDILSDFIDRLNRGET